MEEAVRKECGSMKKSPNTVTVLGALLYSVLMSTEKLLRERRIFPKIKCVTHPLRQSVILSRILFYFIQSTNNSNVKNSLLNIQTTRKLF